MTVTTEDATRAAPAKPFIPEMVVGALRVVHASSRHGSVHQQYTLPLPTIYIGPSLRRYSTWTRQMRCYVIDGAANRVNKSSLRVVATIPPEMASRFWLSTIVSATYTTKLQKKYNTSQEPSKARPRAMITRFSHNFTTKTKNLPKRSQQLPKSLPEGAHEGEVSHCTQQQLPRIIHRPLQKQLQYDSDHRRCDQGSTGEALYSGDGGWDPAGHAR